MKKNLVNIILMGFCVLLLLAPAYASETWLYGMDGGGYPDNIATAPNGDIVVSLSVNNRNVVRVLDSRGGFVHRLDLPYHPTALAVDSAGRILVGVGKHSVDRSPYTINGAVVGGEVRIFDSSFQYIGSLGASAGEFVNPSDIAIDSNGLIYVVDSEADKVKVFNADGSLRSSFGQSGTGSGLLRAPVAIAVDDASGNIYVADKAPQPRVQVFSSAGAYLLSIGVGELTSPNGIAIVSNKVYVADNEKGKILVYPMGGGASSELSAPNVTDLSDLSVSSDGLMFVIRSLSAKKTIQVFGIDQYAYWNVQPKTLDFVAYENGAVPANQSVTISNDGVAALQWTATASDAWVASSLLSGSLNSAQSALVDIGVNQGALAAGVYSSKVNIQNQNGTVVPVTVKLTVKKRPVLSVTPSNLSFSGIAGSSDVIVQSLKVNLTDAAAGATWTASSDAAWMTVNPIQASTATTDAVATISAAGLAAGAYVGHIQVSSADAAGSPSDVTVTFTVGEGSSIAVTTNIAEAAFTVTGDNGSAYTGSGQNWSLSSVAAGTYTVKYADVAGYLTPLSETKTIAGGGVVSFSGSYRDLSLTKSLVVAVGSRTVAGKVGIFTPDGKLAKEFMPFGPQYYAALNVATGDINGDGIDEIIVGYGIGSGKARVAVFNSDGMVLPGTDMVPFWTGNGVKVAAADLDGDGSSELIVGNGEGYLADARVRIFKYANGQMTDTGVDAVVFNTMFGVNVAAADVDGDGAVEVIAAPGPDANASAVIKIMSVDVSGGVGSWRIDASGAEIRAFAGAYGANIATGDLNGDNISEIIVASGSHPKVTNVMLVALKGDGTPYGLSRKFLYTGGVELASGDMDNDGKSEIVIDRMVNPSTIEVLGNSGRLMHKFNAYQRAAYRVKIALGQVY